MLNIQPRFALVPSLIAAIATGCSSPVDEPSVAEPKISYQEVPAGIDSRSPNLAQSGGGLTVLSWIETAGEGHALRYSQLDEGAWSAPVTVAQGSDWFVNWADFPSVVPITDDLIGAHWLVSQPDGGYAYDVHFSMTADGGQTWSKPVIPHTDATPTEHGFVSMYPQSGGIGLLWLDGRNMINEYDPDEIRDGMTLRSAVFDAHGSVSLEQVVDGLICDCCQTDVTMTAAGPLAAYRNRNENEIRDIYVAHAQDGTWQAGQPLGDDNWEIAACPVNGPALAANKDKVAIAWFTGVGDIPKVLMATSADSGRSFSEPVEIAIGNNFGHVGIALLEDGATAVSWLRKSSDYKAELVLTKVSKTGAIGNEIGIGADEPISGYSVPQLSRYGDNLLVAWTAGSYEDSHVRTALVPLSLLK